MKNKKSQIPVLKVILILFITSIIFISMMFFFINAKSLDIDTKKINSQIVIKKILNSNCFSNKYATINKNKFTSENLNNCFTNFDEKVLFSIGIIDVKNKNLIGNYLYFQNKKEEFKLKSSLCNSYSSNSNLLCSSLKYSITYIDENNEYYNQLLIINIISY